MPLGQETFSPNISAHARIASFIETIAEASCRTKLTGIAIGVILDRHEICATSGWADTESKMRVSESTVFEVGSLSKLFTSLLLATAVTKREVNLDNFVQAALGEAVTLPTDGKSQITYRSLANHRSSLPRLPSNLLRTADLSNPYVHYDQEMFYACLNGMKELNPIGSQGEYSNFGVGLLGHALGKLAGSDYHRALKERVLLPLGMRNTYTETRDGQHAPLAKAYQRRNKPTEHWDFTEVTAAAGGVRSSLVDMLKFLRANLFPHTFDLAEEIALMREPSELPKSENGQGFFIPMQFILQVAMIFSIFGLMDLGAYLTMGFLPDWKFYLAMLLVFAASFRWGWCTGAWTLAFVTLLNSWFDRDFAGITFFGGLGVCGFASIWNKLWDELYKSRGGGEGRLAWQSSEVDNHAVLWHNGMVGGATSFLGIIPELDVGVVVLTNTQKSVDAMGIKILKELVSVKEN